ncbi:MAG: hypothetical protein K2N38_02510 [Oscillospiraceae bacterium]|nr:hypothetical protein [Oscillospiraceae bacterium]
MKTISGLKICKYICFALSLTLLCGVPFTGSAYSAETESEVQPISETQSAATDAQRGIADPADADSATALEKPDKIEDRLWEIMSEAEDSELIPVSIWITDIDFDEVEKRVEEQFGLSRDIIDQRAKALRDDKEPDKAKEEQLAEDVQTYIAAQRNTAKEMLVESNGRFVEAFLSGAEDIHTYELFPIIDCGVTKEKLLYLASLGGVESISSNADEDNGCAELLIDCAELSEDEAADTVEMCAGAAGETAPNKK